VSRYRTIRGISRPGRRRRGESTPPIITQDTPASFGPYVAGDTPEDAYTPGTYLTTIGTIDTVGAVWTVNGSPALGTDVLAEDDVVGLSELVTNTNADTRPFGYGTEVVDAAPVAPVISDLAYDTGTNEISLDTDTASGTVYYDLAANSTPLAGAAIEASAMGSVAVSSGVVTEVEDWTGEADGTYWLNVVQKVGGVYSNVLNLEVTIASFNPATLASFFLDAADKSKLWQNTAGSTAVTATNDPVARVDNAGTKGGTLVNTGATDRPLYTVSGGQSYLQFDGSNDYLLFTGSSGDVDMTGGFYLILGLEEQTANSSRSFLSASALSTNALNNTHGLTLETDSAAAQAINAIGGQINVNGMDISDTSAATMAKAVVELEVIPATGATTCWLRIRRSGDLDVVDIGNDAPTSTRFPNDATTTALLALGARLATGSPANFAAMRLYCAAFVPGTVTSQNKTDYRAWAAGKVGF
jgi:hypothetical protein